MEKLFDITIQNRKLLYGFLKETPQEKLFEIPSGFNNNIWWNIAHVVVTQQLLVYNLAGLPMALPDAIVAKYRKGTFPKEIPSNDEVEQMKKWMFALVEKSAEDYKTGLFTGYQEYTTSVNVTLRTIEDAISFNVYHEGLHLGSILALRRALGVL